MFNFDRNGFGRIIFKKICYCKYILYTGIILLIVITEEKQLKNSGRNFFKNI